MNTVCVISIKHDESDLDNIRNGEIMRFVAVADSFDTAQKLLRKEYNPVAERWEPLHNDGTLLLGVIRHEVGLSVREYIDTAIRIVDSRIYTTEVLDAIPDGEGL
jgi:hypothetical protein